MDNTITLDTMGRIFEIGFRELPIKLSWQLRSCQLKFHIFKTLLIGNFLIANSIVGNYPLTVNLLDCQLKVAY